MAKKKNVAEMIPVEHNVIIFSHGFCSALLSQWMKNLF